MTDQRIVSSFTHSPAKIEAKESSEFFYFGGSINGTIEQLVENEKIVQKWRFTDWADGVYSTVTITLDSPEYGETVLKLVQTGVPQEDKFGNDGVPARVSDGWRNHFWERISKVCGFEIIRYID